MMKLRLFLEMKNKLRMDKKKELVILNILIKSQKELLKWEKEKKKRKRHLKPL